MENFELICKLGSGGFSKVYKVRRKLDDQIYALKKVPILNLSEKQKLNSLNEVRVLASIKSKYIINYKEAFLDEKDCSLCLVMEYADRGDLANIIKEHRDKNEYFSEKDIWTVFIQLVKGLKSLHDMGIMHRDIKSSNIFLFSDKTAKLGDLNVCKILSNNSLGHTQAGTPAYAAPEVWMEKPYGLKSDIWSLGCVLYEMITLYCPFRDNNIVKLYNKVLVGEYKKLPDIFSNELNWIIEQMINSDINQRLSCDELLNCEYIQQYLEEFNSHLNIKSHSEKIINKFNIRKRVCGKSDFKCNITDERKEDDTELLKTIYMPDSFLYLKDQLPKSNYNYIDNNNNNKNHSEMKSLTNQKEKSISSSNNTINDILIPKRNSHQPIYFRQKNIDNNNSLFNNHSDNKGQIKLKHFNSVLNPNNIININKNIYYSSSLGNINIPLKKIQNGKSDGNLSNKINDYLYIYQRDKEQQNIINNGRNSQERKFDVKKALFISSDKLKEILKSKKSKKYHLLYTKDFQFDIKLKSKDHINIENDRYNHNSDNIDISNEKNKNFISSSINDIKHNIFLINNKNKGYNNNITNVNKLYNRINNNIYSKNDNDINRKKKKSVDILPKIKLSYS